MITNDIDQRTEGAMVNGKTRGRRVGTVIAVLAGLMLGMSGIATAAPVVAWTDWTSTPNVTPVTGSISLIGGPVGVTYTGQIFFAQTSGGTYYYTTNGTPAPYAGVANAPPTSDIIAMSVAGSRTITFSQAVLNPVMAIVSLNANSYDFVDAPFDVLSYGHGFWGNGTMVEAAGDVLNVTGEGHGVIQFQGSFTSITWAATSNETWHGITVGLTVPGPATGVAVGLGLLLLGARRIRRRP